MAERIASHWPTADGTHRLAVLTGGEPLLQVDRELLATLHEAGFEIAVETNGTVLPPPGIDWVGVSPKAGPDWILRSGNELKLVWPQPGFDLEQLAALPFAHRYLQPMDNPQREVNTAVYIEACLRQPAWKLGTQMHKRVGLRRSSRSASASSSTPRTPCTVRSTAPAARGSMAIHTTRRCRWRAARTPPAW